MNGSASRRGFLRGLTTLPLIGGSVTLIGSPSAAAVAPTPGMMATYSAWLHYERRMLLEACFPGQPDADKFVPCMNPGSHFHFPDDHDRQQVGREAQQRAAVVLAAVGCPLTDLHAEEQWGSTFRVDGRAA